MASKDKENIINHQESPASSPEQIKASPDSLEEKIGDWFGRIKEKSQLDSKAATNLMNDSEADLGLRLPEERVAADLEVQALDSRKEALLEDIGNIVELPGLKDEFAEHWAFETEKKELEIKELKALAGVCYRKIGERASRLGLEISGRPDEAISFKPEDDFNLGTYSTESDSIKVDKSSAKVIIHEELHFSGAVDKRSGRQNLGEKRLSKTGFHSLWAANEMAGEKRDNFRSLNEAVTEKMAQEIFAESQKDIVHELMAAAPDLVERHDQAVEREKQWRLVNAEKNISSDYAYAQEYDMDSQGLSLDEFASAEKERISRSCETLKFANQAQEIVQEKKSYLKEVEILEAILDRLGQVRAGEDGLPLAEARQKEWDDMQRAYLKGETIYLRRLEKVIGPGILRQFNEIDIREAKTSEEAVEKYKEQVNALLKTIRG